MTDDRDYITLMAAVAHNKFLVVVMRYHKSGDEYIQTRVSHEPLAKPAAEALAQSWAAAMNLEIR
jgi:hypothetical protein